jgi:hypothetical protein
MDRPTESGVSPSSAMSPRAPAGVRELGGDSFFVAGSKGNAPPRRAIEKINPGKDAHEIGQPSPGDEKEPSTGSPEG